MKGSNSSVSNNLSIVSSQTNVSRYDIPRFQRWRSVFQPKTFSDIALLVRDLLCLKHESRFFPVDGNSLTLSEINHAINVLCTD